uniref:MYND-type domain-containing protein n=1 Tax=Ditylum brightwellii TaxID=49249 RepID=A0A6V2KAS8_9STRA|mmetsp:Transcript_62484/g.92875  ORF Transcript_62484/g.92875 Transcript_62484/m.92875 type:complete len:161 (-) Transcript_62484:2921-3403(-)
MKKQVGRWVDIMELISLVAKRVKKKTKLYQGNALSVIHATGKILCCSRCHMVYYCSEKCQINHKSIHAPGCIPSEDMRAMQSSQAEMDNDDIPSYQYEDELLLKKADIFAFKANAAPEGSGERRMYYDDVLNANQVLENDENNGTALFLKGQILVSDGRD